MATVFLDTSIIFDEQFLRSARAHAIFSACAILQIKIVIPEVVIDETYGQYRKRAKEKIAALQKAHRELGKIADLKNLNLSTDAVVDAYVDWLDEYLDENVVVRAPYPNITLQDIVQKSYTSKKPFKESGEGHKDYMIWNTILAHIAEPNSQPPFHFLTKNTKDFCEEGDGESKILHSHLAEQIQDQSKRPKVHVSASEFFAEHLAPSLEGMEFSDIKDLANQDVAEYVTKTLEDELSGYTAFGFSGAPFSNDVAIASIQGDEIDEISMKKIGDEIAIEVNGRIDIELDGFIEKSEFYSVAEDDQSDIHVVDGNWNDHVMAVGATIETPFEMTIIYDVAAKAFTSNAITLPEELGDDWY